MKPSPPLLTPMLWMLTTSPATVRVTSGAERSKGKRTRASLASPAGFWVAHTPGSFSTTPVSVSPVLLLPPVLSVSAVVPVVSAVVPVVLSVSPVLVLPVVGSLVIPSVVGSVVGSIVVGPTVVVGGSVVGGSSVVGSTVVGGLVGSTSVVPSVVPEELPSVPWMSSPHAARVRARAGIRRV
jgi:hypothetical protein